MARHSFPAHFRNSLGKKKYAGGGIVEDVSDPVTGTRATLEGGSDLEGGGGPPKGRFYSPPERKNTTVIGTGLSDDPPSAGEPPPRRLPDGSIFYPNTFKKTGKG